MKTKREEPQNTTGVRREQGDMACTHPVVVNAVQGLLPGSLIFARFEALTDEVPKRLEVE